MSGEMHNNGRQSDCLNDPKEALILASAVI